MDAFGKLLICVSVLLAPTQLTAEQPILAVSDVWCPYTCEPDSEMPGFTVDIAKTVFEAEGYSLTYEPMPWARALKETAAGRADIALTAVTGNTAGNFIHQLPLGRDETVIVVRKGEAFKFTSTEQLDNLSLGVIVDYTYDNFGILDQYISQRKATENSIMTVFSDQGVAQLIKMLSKRHIDAFFENRYVTNYFLQQANLSEQFEIIDTGQGDNIYLAFSPNERGQKLLALFNQEFPKLIKNGEYQKILDRYGINH